ncbi:hypothetical protein BC835DRAFT_1416809 [Cytidiella melzeri]|nr:hypothetical protein BC835DRAFT_1416809 [Cytidiella melzeri]
MSVYFTSCGLAAKASDTTHMLGITMSQKWKYTALETLADASCKAMYQDLHVLKKESRKTYDNLNLGFKTYQQQLDNQSHFNSGTAATMYVINHQDVPSPDALAYHTQWERECKNSISVMDLLDQDRAAATRIRAHNRWYILDVLLQSAPFDRKEYAAADDPIFMRPPPVHQLPRGKQHVPTQYMLDTPHIEEMTLEGNDKLFAEWDRQLSLDSDIIQKDLARHKLFFWIGDQLTVSRIRSLKKIHNRDLNLWQRFEHILETFGWLHAQIAQEESIHKQHMSTGTGGLKQAFHLLQRKGLSSTSVQGNFHQKICDAYHHISEAHFRDLWETVGGAKLSDLQSKTPEELGTIADTILSDFASTRAYKMHKQKPAQEQDHFLLNQILFCRDMLDYTALDDAMRTGNVDGGNNFKYTLELLELFQGFLREWPDNLKTFFMRYCWLANTNDGQRFVSFDMLQEHSIRNIKYTFMVTGPYTTWEYIRKISASIPAQRKVKDHVEAEFNHFRRGKSHTSPEKEKDVARLQEAYKDSNIHRYVPKRLLKSSQRAKDFLALGSNPITLQATIDRWAEKRLTVRSTCEMWEDFQNENETTHAEDVMETG